MFYSKAAFECDDGVTRLVVLCAGCLADVLERIEDDVNRWVRAFDGTGVCEFCQHELTGEVLTR